MRLTALLCALLLAACGEDGTAAPEATDIGTQLPETTIVLDSGGSLDIGQPDVEEEEEEVEYLNCTENAECEFDLCVLTQQGKVCTEPCITECPKGFSCNSVTPLGSDPVTVCIPKQLSLCFHTAADRGASFSGFRL